MAVRPLLSLLLGWGVRSAFVLFVSPAVAQGAAVFPDFSGTWERINESWFQPVPGYTGGQPIVEDPAAKTGQSPGDWRNPILQPWAREVVKKNAETEFNNHYVPTAHGTCWPSGVPEVLNLREPVQVMQKKDEIVIIYQRDHQIRWIKLNQPHAKKIEPSWYGDSVGHYEGDTLVVDTIGLAVKKMSVVDPYGTPHTDKLHVEERYQLIQDAKGKGLEVIFTVEDPGAFTMPWKGMVVYRPSKRSFSEVVCAENNRTFGQNETLGELPEAKTPDF